MNDLMEGTNEESKDDYFLESIGRMKYEQIYIPANRKSTRQ
jgi:hypothetical protein